MFEETAINKIECYKYKGNVFNFEVENEHNYIANGFLVKNCNYCLSVDSRIFSLDDPFTKNDIFHFACRGIWVEIMKEEEELPEITGIPESLRERFTGIAEPIHLKKPIYIKKGTPAEEYLKEKEEMKGIEPKVKKLEIKESKKSI